MLAGRTGCCLWFFLKKKIKKLLRIITFLVVTTRMLFSFGKVYDRYEIIF